MIAVFLWLLVTIWNTPSSTIGEAAIREAVRRQRVAPATRVFNDDTLGPRPAAAARPPVSEVIAQLPVVNLVSADVSTPPKNEAWWRARMTTAREALARDRLLVLALESRVAALANDIAARDNPLERAELITARLQALDELDRMKKQVDSDVLAITTIEDEARKAGVPAGWLR